MGMYSFHTTITPCYAWHCLSLIRLVSCLVSSLPSKGSQANLHQGSVPHCHAGVKDATLTLQSIRSLITSHTDVMDDVSARVPMQWLVLRLALPLQTTPYTQHIVLGHNALTFEPVSHLAGPFVALYKFGVCLLHCSEDVRVPASSLWVK